MKAQTNSTIIGRQLQRTLRCQMTDAVVEVIWMVLQNAAVIPHPHPNPPLEGIGIYTSL
ncbi:MAG: hypothetical protein WAO71_01290 [Gallionella sp.]